MEPELPSRGEALPRELIEALPVPAGASVQESAEALVLTVPRKALLDDTGVAAGMLMIAGLGAGVAGSIGASAGLGSGGVAYLFTLLPVLAMLMAVGVGPGLWALLAWRRNHVRVALDGEGLHLREAPVPFTLRRDLPRDGLIGLELVPGARGTPEHLDAVYADGSRHRLIPRLGDERIAGFLAARVGVFLEGPRLDAAQARSKSTTSASDEARISTRPGELA